MKPHRLFAVLTAWLFLYSFSFAHEGFGPTSVGLGGRGCGSSDTLKEKMAKIIIPTLNFENAEFKDVIEVFRKESIEGDPDGEGVNFVVDFSEGFAPRVTLKVRRASLRDAVRWTCFQSGARHYFADQVAVVITDKESEKLKTETYPFQPNLAVMFGVTNRATSGVIDLQAPFETMGLPFPPGASAAYYPATSSITVKNTRENIEILERLLSQMNVIPLQVLFSVTLAELTDIDPAGKHLADIPDEQKTVLYSTSLVGITGEPIDFESGSMSLRVQPIVGPDGYTIYSTVKGRIAMDEFETELDTLVVHWDGQSLITVLSSRSDILKNGRTRTKLLVLELHPDVIDPAGKPFHMIDLSLEEELLEERISK